MALAFAKHNPIAKGTRFEPAKGRYVLYVGYGCPFAHRALLALTVKGLQDTIQVVGVHAAKQRTRPEVDYDKHYGWVFKPENDELLSNQNGHGAFSNEGTEIDPIKGFKTIREIYDHAGAPAGTTYSVPVLYDTKEDTIVSVESGDMMRDLNTQFQEFATRPEIDLYPESLQPKLNELEEWILSDVIYGVYKAGFAKQQQDYEVAFDNFYKGLDRIDEILGKNRYLAGNQLTELDLKLFVCLVRYDEAYSVLYRLNKKMLREYHNLLNWSRDVYQYVGVAETVKMYHIKLIYFANMTEYAPYGIIPKGNDFEENLKKAHDRDTIGKQ
mmetsp:Transcript_24538/g.27913  ORF Transcript_24538/g.27913 Transcript_24538/m.27913 type:complete len:327 (+) Transcript_24538:67-1047(+)